MSGNPGCQRALLLLQQHRPELAEKELRLALAQDPNDATAHAYLAMSLGAQKKHEEGLGEAELAVRLAPDWAFAHYLRAARLDCLDRLDEAQKAIDEAIRLDPTDADYYQLCGGLAYQREDWKRALEWAQRGLAQDPENTGCLNLQSLAMAKLGLKGQAHDAAAAALAKAPENPTSHAVQGWNYLERGDPDRALKHFEEALRLEPGHAYARQGLVEALKARHLVYRVMLQYFLWMARQSNKTQWLVIIGVYVASKFLRAVLAANPQAGPVLIPLLVVIIGFCLLTWFATPLFNLMLVLNRHGWYALTSFARTGGLIWGGLLVTALVSALCGWLCHEEFGYALAFWAGFLLLPVAGAFNAPKSSAQTLLILAGAIAAFGVVGLVAWAYDMAVWTSLAMIFALGCMFFTWIANVAVTGRKKH